MFIIFDLDDTLVDTSACLMPFKLAQALDAMIQAGMVVEDRYKALCSLQAFDHRAENAKVGILNFLTANGYPLSFAELAIEIVYAELPPELSILPVPGALEVLPLVSQEHVLAIVTIGRFQVQIDKLKKAGIDPEIFSKIIVAEERNKRPHYQALVQEFPFAPDEVIVCGDRISLDLSPAKAMGFQTVHMFRGRGRYTHPSGPLVDVDHTVADLWGIEQIIKRI